MINSFKADLYRLKRSKGTYICLGVIAILYALTLGFKSSGGISFGVMPDERLMNAQKLDIKQMMLNFNYYFYLIMPVFMIIIPEFTEQAYKNTITSVSDKKNFYISKFILCEIVGLCTYVVTTFAFYFANKVINGSKYTSSFDKFAPKVFILVPVIMFIIAFFAFVAFLFRKASVFNSVTIVLPLVISLLVSLFAMNKTLEKTVMKLYNYELGSMMYRLVAKVGGDVYFARSMAICVIGTALLFAFGLKLFNERELG